MNNDESALVQYYKSFKSTYGALAGLVTAIPFWSKLVPGYGAYLFPPVGILEGPARVVIFTIAAAGTYFAFVTKGTSMRGDRKRTVIALILAFVSVLCISVFSISSYA